MEEKSCFSVPNDLLKAAGIARDHRTTEAHGLHRGVPEGFVSRWNDGQKRFPTIRIDLRRRFLTVNDYSAENVAIEDSSRQVIIEVFKTSSLIWKPAVRTNEIERERRSSGGQARKRL